MNTRALQHKENAAEPILYMAMELSKKQWKLVFGDGRKRRQVTIEGGDLEQLREALQTARERFQLSKEIRTMSCYEAGRDGFWLHRYLLSIGIENQVVDSSSIEVNRRKRCAKTDRIDGNKLLTMLIRYHGGEADVWSVVRVPSVADEDARRLHRELERLKKERTSHRNRIQGLLVGQGIRLSPRRDFRERLSKLTVWDGGPLPEDLKGELEREYERLCLVAKQIRALEVQQTERIKHEDSKCMRQVAQLMALRAIGQTSAWIFVMEFFGWRAFRNRREVASLAGLTGTPYDSGDSQREQGISKAGNRRVRTLAIEICWFWLRYQPNSKLSLWFKQRFADGGKRMRRVGIVAMARRLLIALWHYVEHGVVPEGAELKPV